MFKSALIITMSCTLLACNTFETEDHSLSVVSGSGQDTENQLQAIGNNKPGHLVKPYLDEAADSQTDFVIATKPGQNDRPANHRPARENKESTIPDDNPESTSFVEMEQPIIQTPVIENIVTTSTVEPVIEGQTESNVENTKSPTETITVEPVTVEPVAPSEPVDVNLTQRYSFKSSGYLNELELSQNIYYVDSGAEGSDSNPGTKAEPFKTIQFGISKLQRNPGYDLIIKNGTYNETVSIVGLNGTGNDPLVIRAESPQGVTLNTLQRTKHKSEQNKGSLPNAAIVIENSSYLKLAGIHINGSRGFGIRVDNSSHILLKQNKTYNTGQSGIKANYVDNLDLMWNEIQRAVQVFNQECLSVENLTNFRIIGNKIHDRPVGSNVYSLQSDYILTYPIGKNKAYYQNCYADDPYDFEASGQIRMQTTCATKGGEGLDVKNGSKHGEVAYNIIENIENKFGLYLDAWGIDDDGTELIQEDIEVHHNIVKGAGSGIALSTENGSSEKGLLRDISIHDNIVYGSQKSALGMGDHGGYTNSYRIDKVRRVEDIEIYNNVFLNNGSHGLWLVNPNARNIYLHDNLIAHNVMKQVYLGSVLTKSTSIPTYKYNVVENLIDTTSRDYDWLDEFSNFLVNLPQAEDSNGYLSELSVVANSHKGLMVDKKTMIDQLSSLVNN